MATSVTPGREAAPAAATPAAPAPGAGGGGAGTPAVRPLDAAFAAARDLVAQRTAGAGATGGEEDVLETPTTSSPAPGAVPDGSTGVTNGDEPRIEGDGSLEPEPDLEGSPTPAEPDLTVTIDGAREGESVQIQVDSVETADRLRQLQRAAMRGNQARAMREQAEQMRNEGEEFRFMVEADPAGVVNEIITQPADQAHLAQFLLTRPGVLEQVRSWVEALISADDVTIGREGKLIEADRLTRRDAVQMQIQEKRELNRNASQLVARAERAIEAFVPEGWTEEQKGLLYTDILGDIRATARAENVRVLDPRRVDGMVQRRLTLLGLAPRVAAPVSDGTPPAGKPPAVQKRPTPETFKAARGARASAASAPPGVGSPAAQIPKPPAYDPTKRGTPIQQAAAFARSIVSAVRKPQ